MITEEKIIRKTTLKEKSKYVYAVIITALLMIIFVIPYLALFSIHWTLTKIVQLIEWILNLTHVLRKCIYNNFTELKTMEEIQEFSK